MTLTKTVYGVYDSNNNLLKVFTDKGQGIETMLSWGIEAELRTHKGLTQKEIQTLTEAETKKV